MKARHIPKSVASRNPSEAADSLSEPLVDVGSDSNEENSKEDILESAPESERWDPIPGSKGQKAPVNPSADEDPEGRSDNEQLVDEGIAEADRDQMRQANKIDPAPMNSRRPSEREK